LEQRPSSSIKFVGPRGASDHLRNDEPRAAPAIAPIGAGVLRSPGGARLDALVDE